MSVKNLPLAFKVSSKYFDATATIESGQTFRFQKTDGGYHLFSMDKRCFVKTEGEFTYVYTTDKDYFYKYFDLQTNYEKIVSTLSKYDELRVAIDGGRGIRILRQDLVETIICFIVSANNNIPRIKKIISRLCEIAGQKMDGFYAFPTLNEMYLLPFSVWQSIGAGFRDKYLFSTVKMLKETDILDSLKFKIQSAEERTKLLCTLSGVGPKVADCISLFGLYDLSVFPVDTWIFKTCSQAGLDTPKKVREFYSKRYGDLAGIAQQYLFFGAIGGKSTKP